MLMKTQRFLSEDGGETVQINKIEETFEKVTNPPGWFYKHDIVCTFGTQKTLENIRT